MKRIAVVVPVAVALFATGMVACKKSDAGAADASSSASGSSVAVHHYC